MMASKFRATLVFVISACFIFGVLHMYSFTSESPNVIIPDEAFVRIISKDISYNKQLKTLESIHDLIWKRIKYLQEEGDCETKKILICKNTNIAAGTGAMAASYVVCLQVAYGLGRMFLIDQPEYDFFGGYSGIWMKNESVKCGYLKNKYRSYGNVCNTHDKKCYLSNGFDINNTIKVLKYTSESLFPAPRRIPGTLPKDIEHALIRLKVRTPWIWFSSQFMGYIMLRLKPRFADQIEKYKEMMNYQLPTLSVHIRRGDKSVGDHVPHTKSEAYSSQINKYFSKGYPNGTDRRIFLASDEKNIFAQYKKRYPTYLFLNAPVRPKFLNAHMSAYMNKDFLVDSITTIMVDIHLLLYANFTICTQSSNICRIICQLKMSTPPFTEENTIAYADTSNQLQYYLWWGYAFPNHLWITFRENTRNITFFTGISLRPYKRGLLFRRITEIFVINKGNISYSVLYVEPYDTSVPHERTYILLEDVFKWPGNPRYHFEN